MDNKCYHIFTHNDLDGALSLLVFKWFNPDAHITFKAVNNINVEAQIEDYLSNTINPHDIYVLDIALRESFLAFDKECFTFIDHHARSTEYKDKFKKAKIIHKPYTSNCKLIYKLFEKTNPIELSKLQKLLVVYGDDYDSGSHTIQDAYDLNVLYWLDYKNSLFNFISDYKDGWVPFTKSQQKNIRSVKLEASSELDTYPLFKGTLNIFGKEKKCMATFGSKVNSISIDILFNRFDIDIFFYINNSTEKVTMRQKRKTDMIDLSEFAKKYCDGNGHDNAAGGKLTPLFMELTKNFQPL